MLLTVYFPVTDLRHCFPERRHVVTLPKWPSPTAGKENFQRNLGPLITRPLGGVRGWVGENDICNVGNGLVIRGLSRDRLLNQLKLAFKRFYYDGNGAGYFSLGFNVPVQTLAGLSGGTFPDRIGLATLAFCSKHIEGENPIRDAGRIAADLFARGSETGNLFRSAERFVFGGPPIAVVSLDIRDRVPDDNLRSLSIRTRLATHGGVVLFESSALGQKTPTFVLTSWEDGQDVRFVRLAIARLYSELHFLERAADLLSSTYVNNVDNSGGIWLGERLNIAVSRLIGRNAPSFLKTADAYAGVVESFSTLYKPGRIDDLMNGLHQVGARRGLVKGILEIVSTAFQVTDRERKQYVVNFNVEGMHVGSKYDISGGNIGSVGDNAKAENFSQVSNSVSIDAAKLSGELLELIGHLKVEASTPDQFNDLAVVAEAQVAAESGDAEGAASRLKTVGRWVLDVAQKVGVALAAGVLKGALGL